MCAADTAVPKRSRLRKGISGHTKGRKKVKASDFGVIEYMKQEAAKQGIHDPRSCAEDIISLGKLKEQIILRQLDNKMTLQMMMWNRWLQGTSAIDANLETNSVSPAMSSLSFSALLLHAVWRTVLA